MNKEPKSLSNAITYRNLKIGGCPSCDATVVCDIEKGLMLFHCMKCGEYLQILDKAEMAEKHMKSE